MNLDLSELDRCVVNVKTGRVVAAFMLTTQAVKFISLLYPEYRKNYEVRDIEGNLMWSTE